MFLAIKLSISKVLKVLCLMITKLSTVEPCYNHIGLYDTWHIKSDILWYQLIPHF